MFRKKTQRQQTVEARRKRQHFNSEEEASEQPRHLNKWYWGLFALFFVIVTVICFLGQTPAETLFRHNQIANIQVTAEFPFEYESQIQTANRVETLKQQVAPVYRIEQAHLTQFEDTLKQLIPRLEAWQLEERLKGEPKPASATILQPLLKDLPSFDWAFSDFADLVNLTEPEPRKRLFEESILVLKDILRNGVYGTKDSETLFSNNPFMVNLDIQGAATRAAIQPYEEALRQLRINIYTMSGNPEITRALYRIIKTGLVPNLVFDKEATAKKVEQVVQSVKPVRVYVSERQVIIKPGTQITREHLEQLNAYRSHLREQNHGTFGINALFLQNSLLAFTLILCTALLCYVGSKRFTYFPRHLGLLLLLVSINLLWIRGMLALASSDLVISQWKIADVLAYASPVAFATLLGSIMLGVHAAILISLIVSLFFAMMHGYSLEMLTISLLVNAVTLYYCRDIRFRAKVVKAGFMAGVTAVGVAVFIGLIDGLPLLLILQESIAALLIGFITGILAIGLLPLLENTFKLTTDITLLELTDFNHPLLRRMQLTAPGSYHHSLMVANLAERAAASIHANALQCRVCSLFHDIGKMVKPEYFTENQRNGVNPHLEKNPSMSALVIKSHVKEGAVMARQNRLPSLIVSAIEQHHGTGLIWYFYHRACQLQEANATGGTRDPFKVDQRAFRYEGPRPQSRENAIIMLADSVEAASRSLQKPSATNIEELVEKIFKTNLDDGQLDEAPITMKELRRVKESLIFTLLNTLHHRTEYPDRGVILKPPPEAELKSQEPVFDTLENDSLIEDEIEQAI